MGSLMTQIICLFCSGFGTSEEEDDSDSPYDCEACGGAGWVDEDPEDPNGEID